MMDNIEPADEESKQKIVGIIQKLSRPSIQQIHFVTLRFSQFYRICRKLHGSMSAEINKYSAKQNQHEYYNLLSAKLSMITNNISSFVFGIQCPPYPNQQLIKYPEIVNSTQIFYQQVDRYILTAIEQLIKSAIQRYNQEYIVSIIAKAKLLRTKQNFQEQTGIELEGQWMGVIRQYANIHTLNQVVQQIKQTYQIVNNFRINFSRQVIIQHGDFVMQSLAIYGKQHKRSQYNATSFKK